MIVPFFLPPSAKQYTMRTYRASVVAAVATVCAASNAGAAPSSSNSQLYFNNNYGSSFETATLSLTQRLSSKLSKVLGLGSAVETLYDDSENKSIWEIINDSDEFAQLAHVLNYSSDATKDILKKKEGLTFFAPMNWHHHRHEDHDSEFSSSQSSVQHWKGIQKQIAAFETDYPVTKYDDKHDDTDEDKKRRRAIIKHLIDAEALYHLVDSKTPLDAQDLVGNSSVATLLATGKEHRNNDGTNWRVRTGKSLLPVPGVYLNFYSRVVKPDIKAKNGLVHAIKYPLILPPDVLQSLFFGQTTFSTTTSALQKVNSAKYLQYRPYHSHHHGHHGGEDRVSHRNDSEHHHHASRNFSGVPAETIFVPSNLAWSRLPFGFRAYLFSPWGYHLLQKVFMLHSLPADIVYADFVHHVSHSGHKVHQPTMQVTSEGNKTSYTFDSVLPAIHGKKGEHEQVDVDVYRYHLFPGGKGPVQTRMVVQNVPIILQDIPASNGVFHAIDRFIKPKEHPHKGVWAEIASGAEEAGFGTVDLHAEAAANLW